ncbi:MAG: hypothetical protein NT154_24390, partial [Verrucomicrobia bacterium]|nr:hypothetical protein [Verrucomicrobiota bacterium]
GGSECVWEIGRGTDVYGVYWVARSEMPWQELPNVKPASVTEVSVWRKEELERFALMVDKVERDGVTLALGRVAKWQEVFPGRNFVAVMPGTKKPIRSGYRDPANLSEWNADRHYLEQLDQVNIALDLRKPDAAFDFDSDEAAAAFKSKNPWAAETHTKIGGRGETYLVRMEGDYPQQVINILGPNREHVGEFRGETTVILDGIHASGKLYTNRNFGHIVTVRYSEIDWPEGWTVQAERPADFAGKCSQLSEQEMDERQRIVHELLGDIDWETPARGFCKCPGERLHTNPTSARSTIVYLDNVPTIKCVHTSCADAVEESNHELRSRVGKAEYRPEKRVDTTKMLCLPSGHVSITQSAQQIFERIAPTERLFHRGGAFVELVKGDSDEPRLELLTPDAFRSFLEKEAPLFAWRSGRGGEPVLKPSQMSTDTAKALLASSEARTLLPKLTAIVRCPILTETGVLYRGYHPELGGVFVEHGESVPLVELEDATRSLKMLVDQFDFQGKGDHSRALAMLLTPALRMGGFLKGPVPVDVGEANESQAGKGYRHKLVASVYNDVPHIIAKRTGGVGSMDESLATALVIGRTFICLDNLRGKLDSQFLEAMLTADGLFAARTLHREVMVDPSRFILQATSNGVETTRDFANRSCITRIRKRENFNFRDMLGKVRREQPHYLGCVFTIISAWTAAGKPRTGETGHDFREWCQVLDWIVRNVLDCAPLMDGHLDLQSRISNPALVWLRAVSLAIEQGAQLEVALSARQLAEVCEANAITIPGVRGADILASARVIGGLTKKVFGSEDTVELEGFSIERGEREYRKPSGDLAWMPTYTFWH